jgi:hypothetical protein
MNPTTDIEHLVFSIQNQDEKVIKIIRSAFILQLPWLIVCSIIVSGLFYLGIEIPFLISDTKIAGIANFVTFCLTLATLFFALNKYFCWFYSVNIITTQRILDFNFSDIGIKSIQECLIKNIQSVSIRNTRSIVGFVFGVSTLEILTSGDNPNIVFEDIYKGNEIQDIISDLTRGFIDKDDTN